MNILITYTTVSGNTEIVCQTVQKHLESKKNNVLLQKCDHTSEEQILSADLIIFACPTYAHGELQVYYQQFLRRINNINLEQKNCAIIGLGDDKYDDDYNVESAVLISDFIKSHQGTQVIEPLKINKSPLPQLDKQVKDWAEELAQKI
jgi:flavodoxin I